MRMYSNGGICNPNKKNINSNDFNIIARISESETLTRYVLRDYKWKFNGEN